MANDSACIWCGCRAPLVLDKPYCSSCSSKCLRECISCHKPYPSLKYFTGFSPRCNSCQVKLERVKRKKKEVMEKPVKHKPSKLISDDEEEEVIDIGSRSPSPCSSVSSDGEEKAEKVPQREGKKKKKAPSERQMKIGEFFSALNSAEADEKKKAPKRKYNGKRSADPYELLKAERDFACSLAKYNRVLGKKSEFHLKIA